MTFRNISLWLVSAFFSSAVFTAPAHAHPHVWVTGATTLKFDKGKLAVVSMRWQFDAFFSQVLLGDYDKNRDGKFDAEETAAMKTQVFTSLKEYGYFTHLKVGETVAGFDRVENFSTDSDKGELIYNFDLILTTPSDLTKADAQLKVYDPSIYVDIILAGEPPVKLAGEGSEKCHAGYGTGDEISNPNGFVTAQVVTVSCKTKT